MPSTVQSGSLPLPMSMASWPGGLPPMGYSRVDLILVLCFLALADLNQCLDFIMGEMTFFFSFLFLSRYMAPVQGVVSMDGSAVSSTDIQACRCVIYVNSS